MANYVTLKKGSSGSSVKELQEKLNSKGNYGLQTDGVFGSKTLAAVQDYQKNNGLQVDGIVGENTWGSLNGGNTANTQTVTQATAPVAEAPKNYRYDYGNDPVYQAALKQQEEVKANAPTYAGTFDQQVKDLFDQVMNKKDFSYDLNGDALWRQYKDQYANQGKMAMMDTMGQAAALTGGYGSSYSQAAGQQAYQGYLQQLNDRVPELYQLALDKYNNEQAMLKDKFGAAAQMQADEYGKYQDALGQHNIDVDRAQSAADTAYDRGNNAWLTEEQLRRDDEDTAYTKQQTEYDKLANLIASTGYTPGQAELAAAGMSATQAAAYGKAYSDSQKTARTAAANPVKKGENESYHGVKVAGSGSLSAENIRMIQWSLGIETTGVWDQATVDASGYKNSNDCYKDWSAGKVVNATEWRDYYLPQMQQASKINARIKKLTSDAEKEAEIQTAYEAGLIDEAMTQELLRQNGLV